MKPEEEKKGRGRGGEEREERESKEVHLSLHYRLEKISCDSPVLRLNDSP